MFIIGLSLKGVLSGLQNRLKLNPVFMPLCFFPLRYPFHVSLNFSFDLDVNSVYMWFLRNWLAIFSLMRSDMKYLYLCHVYAFMWNRLLASLTQSLESSGLDLSQASISVQINLGKRAKRPATAATSSAKVCFSLFFKLFYVMDKYLTHHREFYLIFKVDYTAEAKYCWVVRAGICIFVGYFPYSYMFFADDSYFSYSYVFLIDDKPCYIKIIYRIILTNFLSHYR